MCVQGCQCQYCPSFNSFSSVAFNSPIGSSLPTLTSVHPIPHTGELDHIPEVAFYMVGNIDDVLAAADKLAQ